MNRRERRRLLSHAVATFLVVALFSTGFTLATSVPASAATALTSSGDVSTGEVTVTNPDSNPTTHVDLHSGGMVWSADIDPGQSYVFAPGTSVLAGDAGYGTTFDVSFDGGTTFVSSGTYVRWDRGLTLIAPPAPENLGNVVRVPEVSNVYYFSSSGARLSGYLDIPAGGAFRAIARPGFGYTFASSPGYENQGPEVTATRPQWNYPYQPTVPVRVTSFRVTKKPTTRSRGTAYLAVAASNGAPVSGRGVLVLARGLNYKWIGFEVRDSHGSVRIPRLAKGGYRVRATLSPHFPFEFTKTAWRKFRVR